MIETSSLIFSAGRDDTNMYAGSRGRFGGDVLEFIGLASTKQTFLPPGVAVYAPQSPNWPSRVGCAAPAAAAGAGAAGAVAGFGAAGFCAGGLPAGGSCCAG